MWQIYAFLAQDIARERRREAAAAALAREAAAFEASERRAHPGLVQARRIGRARRALAASLRRVSAGAAALARSACDAAARLDGQAA
jgi:hypothetical protein